MRHYVVVQRSITWRRLSTWLVGLASCALLAGCAAAPPTSTVSTSPTAGDLVALCPFTDGSGVTRNLPCDSPEFGSAPTPTTAAGASDITCDTPCTTSGCEQYQDSVLNC